MRIQLDNQIILCKKIEYHSYDKTKIFITSIDENEIYLITFPSIKEAEQFYHEIFIKGYSDVDDYNPLEIDF